MVNDKTRTLLGDHEATRLVRLSLFLGIGGLNLAAEWTGFTTIGQCEWADYPTRVLEEHWPDVSRWRSIRTLTKESSYEKTGLRIVDIISGGFPCQPLSVAGKQRSKGGDRYLWLEVLRVIPGLQPTQAVGENVAGIVNMALGQVCADLESEDYSVQAFIIPAYAVNTPHRYDRCTIIGCRVLERKRNRRGWKPNSPENSDCVRFGKQEVLSQQPRRTEFEQDGKDEANVDCSGLEEQGMQGLPEKQEASIANGGWWPAGPDVGRISYGVPPRVDRLKYLGSAVVPQQFHPIFRAIAGIERGTIHG